MISHVAILVMSAVLGQVPAEGTATWLRTIPVDVDIVIRSRGLEPTVRELGDMIKAMSPAGAEVAVPGLTSLLTQFQNQHGAEAVKTPWVGLVRAVPPGPDGMVPFAVLILQEDYRGVLKALAGGKDVPLTPQEGGIDSFDNPHGNGVWYAVKGPGFVAFGPDKGLIAAVAKPGAKTLDKVLSPALTESFMAGDLGLFVNLARLADRYADQIAQARQAMVAGLDRAAQQAPNGASMEAAKVIYGGLFDSLKDANLLALSLDVAPQGLRLAADLEVKADSDAAKAIASSRTNASDLGKLPSDAAFFVALNLDASTYGKWQGMSMRMLSPGGKLSPELTRAVQQLDKIGRIDTMGASWFEDGMRVLNVTNASDPQAYIAATEAMIQAMAGADSPLNFYKEVKVEANAQTHQGITFTHVVAEIDQEKLAKLGGADNPAGAASMKAVFGGNAINYWIGTDGKRVIQVTTPTWDEAKARLDAYAKEDSDAGTLPNFREVQSALADRGSLKVILSAQGLVRMFAAQFGTLLNKPELKDLGGVPKEPAFFGLSLTPRPPAGYEFHFVLPSRVGPVIEHGMIPVFRALQGNVNQ